MVTWMLEAHQSQDLVLHRLFPCLVSSEDSLNFILLQRQLQRPKEDTTKLFLLPCWISFGEVFSFSPVLNEDMVPDLGSTDLLAKDGRMADISVGRCREVIKEH